MLPIKWMPTESLVDGVFNSKTDVWYKTLLFNKNQNLIILTVVPMLL
jgi:hypothetical protein